MKGIELCKKYYLSFGKDMIESVLGSDAKKVAVGIAGEGSECLGYDDEISTDHDFEPSFTMWITKEDEREFGFKLMRAYSKLPKSFEGYERQNVSPVGGNRRGVVVIDDFYNKFLGLNRAPETPFEWLKIPEQNLLSATNGEVFTDPLGEFSKIREEIKKGYPEDVRLKKIAARAIFMAQAGQYNYERLVRRGEIGGAGLSLYEFVKNAISCTYLLNNAFEPYYKWAFRGMKDLKILGDIGEPLSFLLSTGNEKEEAKEKQELIENISSAFIEEFKNQNITSATCNNLETHAYSITDKIKDPLIRSLHVMDGVN